jgi:hypothetical protein
LTLADQVGGCTAALTLLFKRREACVLKAVCQELSVPLVASPRAYNVGE